MKKQPQRIPFEDDYEGKTYRGWFSVSSNAVSVWFMGKDGVEVGPNVMTGIYPDGGKLQAKILLREILDGAKARGEL